MDSVVARRGRTSTGTWYVAPPTRRERTSSGGLTLSIARFKVESGSVPVLTSIAFIAS